MRKIHMWVIVLMLLSGLSILNSVTEAEESRWHVIMTPYEHDSVAVDIETMEYNKENNTLSYWTKTMALTRKGTYLETRCFSVLNYTNKTTTLKRMLTYSGNDISDTADKGREVISYVKPDSEGTLVADYATKTLSTPKLFPTPVDNWRWVMSTDKYTCTISPDSFMDDHGYFTAYIRKAYISFHPEYEVYHFDFDNDRIVEIDYYGNISYRDIIPESVDEKIYKAAYDIFKSKN